MNGAAPAAVAAIVAGRRRKLVRSFEQNPDRNVLELHDSDKD